MSLQQQWEAIKQTPDYQQSGDAEREAKRLDFRRQVESRFAPSQRNRVREIFDQKAPPEYGDPNSGGLNDTWQTFKAGLYGSSGDIVQGLALGHENPLSDTLRQWAEEEQGEASPSMIRDIQNFGFEKTDQGWGLKQGSTWQGLYGNVISGAGSLVPSIGGGAVITKGLGIAGRAAAGLGRLESAAVAGARATSADAALKRGEQIASMAGKVGYGTTGAAMVTGGTSHQTFEEHMAMPAAQKMQSDRYRQILTEENNRLGGVDPNLAETNATQRWAEEASLSQRGKAALLGAVTGAITGPLEARLFTGRMAGTRLGNMGKGAIAEGVEESLQSGGQQYLANKAAIESGGDPDRDPFQQVAESAVTGGVLGALIGGPVAGIAKPRVPESQDQLKADLAVAEVKSDALEQNLINAQNEDDYQQAKADLANNYRKKFNLRQQIEGEPTLDDFDLIQIRRNGVDAASREERQWVPDDVDARINQLTDDLNTREQKLKRQLKHGGGVDELRRGEQDIARRNRDLRLLKTAADNRSNQVFFASAAEFNDWTGRVSQGGNIAAQAQRELTARKEEFTASAQQKMGLGFLQPGQQPPMAGAQPNSLMGSGPIRNKPTPGVIVKNR